MWYTEITIRRNALISSEDKTPSGTALPAKSYHFREG